MLAKQSIVRELRERRRELASRFGVRRIGLFGSYARGEATRSGDMEFLVEFDTPTFDHYMDLKFYLDDLFGVSVRLVPSGAVKPRLKLRIDRDIVYAWGPTHGTVAPLPDDPVRFLRGILKDKPSMTRELLEERASDLEHE